MFKYFCLRLAKQIGGQMFKDIHLKRNAKVVNISSSLGSQAGQNSSQVINYHTLFHRILVIKNEGYFNFLG